MQNSMLKIKKKSDAYEIVRMLRCYSTMHLRILLCMVIAYDDFRIDMLQE